MIMMQLQEIDGLRMIDQQVHEDNASRAEDVNELAHHPTIGRLPTSSFVAPWSAITRGPTRIRRCYARCWVPEDRTSAHEGFFRKIHAAAHRSQRRSKTIHRVCGRVGELC